MRTLIMVIFSLWLGCCGLCYALPRCEPVSKVNLNTANLALLMHAFKGIGKQRAQAIISYRETAGEFSSVAELAHVKNIGYRFVKQHLLELETVFTV